MAVSVSHFLATTLLNNGSVGLLQRPGSISVAAITGSGLTNGLTVTVATQGRSPIRWTGVTSGATTDQSLCLVVLTQARPNDGSPSARTGKPPGEEPVAVNVTVGTAPPATGGVNLGHAPVLLNGSYCMKCNASGTYRWLAVDSSNNVNLANEHDTPQQWAVNLITDNDETDYYTIQTANGQYLNQSSPTTVSLVSEPGSGTSWQLISNPNGTNICFIGDPDGYLCGNTSNKDVNLVGQPNSNNSTSWTIGE